MHFSLLSQDFVKLLWSFTSLAALMGINLFDPKQPFTCEQYRRAGLSTKMCRSFGAEPLTSIFEKAAQHLAQNILSKSETGQHRWLLVTCGTQEAATSTPSVAFVEGQKTRSSSKWHYMYVKLLGVVQCCILFSQGTEPNRSEYSVEEAV